LSSKGLRVVASAQEPPVSVFSQRLSRREHAGSRQPRIAQHTARHALSLSPHADRPLDSRAAACPTPRNVKRRLEWARCRQTQAKSSRPSRPFRTPLARREGFMAWRSRRSSIHATRIHEWTRATPRGNRVRRFRARHGRHVFINALR